MAAASRNLLIDLGSRFAEQYVLFEDDARTVRRNLSGYSVRMQIRKFANTPNPPIWDSATPGSGSSLTVSAPGTTGTINLVIGATVTAGFASGEYVYDMEIVNNTDPNDVTRIFEGKAIVRANVTK